MPIKLGDDYVKRMQELQKRSDPNSAPIQQPIKNGPDPSEIPGTAEYAKKYPLFQSIHLGNQAGEREFIQDPSMQSILKQREELAKGLNAKEIGAQRSEAINSIQGQRNQYLRQMASRAGKAGIGGARAAAMGAAADRGFDANRQEAERKLTLDNANAVRQGVGDWQDFLMRQKIGKLGTGLAYGQLYAGQTASQNALAAANKEPSKGFLGNLFDGIF